MRRTIKNPLFGPLEVDGLFLTLLTLVLTVSLVGSVGAGCPVGDMSGDCKVDWEDLLVFAGQWLDTDSSGESLVAHWKLDGNADDPVGGNHGTVCGSTEWTIGKIDGALDFGGGVGDYVDCGNDSSLNLTNNFSISAWFKPDNTGLFLLICKGNVPAYDPGGAYTILCVPGGDILAFYVRDSNDTEFRYTSTSVPLYEWTHVVGTFSDGNIKIYKDGDPPVSNTLGTTEINSNTGPLGIGAEGDGETPFNGTIDDVRIYGRVLSEAEVREIMNLGMPDPYCADLDRDGNVNLSDFTQLAENWQKKGNPLIINEFLASNSSCNPDPQGQYDDWLEIYNNSSVTIDIGGMYLTDDLNEPTSEWWQIPDNFPAETTISAYGYLLIWADGDTDQGTLHASFAIKNGEVIGLYDADENLVDSISINDQVTDVSYGRYPDAGDTWRFMGFPTPGSQNNGGYLGQVADTEFSHNRGFYDEDFNVTITSDTPGAAIRYTTDSSAPTETHGNPYVAAIPIEGTTCLRAAAFKAGYLSSNVDTHTYIFIDGVVEHPDMSTDITQDPIWGPQMEDALLEIPTISLVTPYTIPDTDPDDPVDIYRSPPEVPVSIEMIFPDGTKGFQANACAERFGGQYTVWPKQALRISFKSIYGPSRLDFDLFGDTPYGGDDATDSFNQIILRNGSHDSLFYGGYTSKGVYTRNRYCFDRQIEMGHLSLRGKFVHMYLNGVYWGQYHLMERPTADFMATYLGGDEEDYDIMKGRSGIFVMEGDSVAWNYLVANRYNYAIVQEYMDVDNYIDYMLLNFYGANDHDWYSMHNWVAGRKREAGNKFMFFMWDNDFLFRRLYDTTIDNGGPANMFPALRQHEEFKIRLADRAQKHFFNDGMLTPARVQADFTELTNRIERTIVPECARWRVEGNVFSNNLNYDPDTLQQSVDWIKFDWGNVRTDITVQQMRDEGLFPSIVAPSFNQHGGPVSLPFNLVITAPAGTIYYTLDGSDPRATGGAAVGTPYLGQITLTKSVIVKARAQSGSTWSALNEATFAVGPVADNLRITEMMYHPQDTNNPDDPNAEFIELKNIGLETTINLSLVRFTEGINFTFPSLELTAGEYVLLVKDQALFASRYTDVPPEVDILGPYEGRLANTGERIKLEDAIGRTILDFEYSDGWHPITDGDGFSLTIIDPTNDDPNSWGEKDSWRASDYVGGSPGEDNPGVFLNPGAVVINEVMAHSHLAPDWIELYNTTGASIDIGGWFLSDNDANLMKYKIEDGMTIDSNSYLVFYEDVHFGDGSNPDIPFALSENGEEACLSSAEGDILTGYREVEDFGASETGVSFGRYFKSSTGNYNFVAMDYNTPWELNAPPKVGPIVISEIMYHPDWPDDGSYNNDEYEYIELHNITDADVNLYDEEGIPWKFTDGIDFTFPDGPDEVTIPANGYLLVVKNPAAFGWRYPSVLLPPERILGPYDGRLNNAGERLEISMPGDVDEGVRQYIRIDRVNYSDGSHPEDCPGGVDHWPTEADGNGESLTRKVPADYGNDVANWKAASPSPGSSNP